MIFFAKPIEQDLETTCMCFFEGGKKTGKTAIISQFLYDKHPPSYKETIEEMYRYIAVKAF